MTSAIVPETVDVEILEDSAMTESEEKELVIVKTAIQTAYLEKFNATCDRCWDFIKFLTRSFIGVKTVAGLSRNGWKMNLMS